MIEWIKRYTKIKPIEDKTRSSLRWYTSQMANTAERQETMTMQQNWYIYIYKIRHPVSEPHIRTQN